MIATMWGNYVGWLSALIRLNRRLSLAPPLLFGELLHPYYEEVFWDNLPRHGKRVFREHNAYVKRIVPPERLLVYDVREGWNPLCAFLGKSMPKTKFPNKNDQIKYKKEMSPFRWKLALNVLGLLTTKGVFAIVVATVVWKWWLG